MYLFSLGFIFSTKLVLYRNELPFNVLISKLYDRLFLFFYIIRDDRTSLHAVRLIHGPIECHASPMNKVRHHEIDRHVQKGSNLSLEEGNSLPKPLDHDLKCILPFLAWTCGYIIILKKFYVYLVI